MTHPFFPSRDENVISIIWLFNIAMERSIIFKNRKPSISMGHTMANCERHNQRLCATFWNHEPLQHLLLLFLFRCLARNGSPFRSPRKWSTSDATQITSHFLSEQPSIQGRKKQKKNTTKEGPSWEQANLFCFRVLIFFYAHEYKVSIGRVNSFIWDHLGTTFY